MNKSNIIAIALFGAIVCIALVEANFHKIKHHHHGHHGGYDGDYGFGHGGYRHGHKHRYPIHRGGYRRGGFGGLNQNTHFGNDQFAQGSQGGLIAAGGRFINEHDNEGHLDQSHLHGFGGRSKDRTIVKESDDSFGNINADSLSSGHRTHDLNAGEGGLLAAHGSQGSIANRQNFDQNLNAFGAGGSSGFNEFGI